MRILAVGCVVLGMLVPPAAMSRGVGGMHHSASRSGSVTGGAAGTRPTAPGTNSAGTALSSSGTGNAIKGPALGTGNALVDKEDRKVDRMIGSICRGC